MKKYWVRACRKGRDRWRQVIDIEEVEKFGRRRQVRHSRHVFHVELEANKGSPLSDIDV